MFTDALLSFVPIGSPLSLVGAAGIAIPSTLIIDLIGPGVGMPVLNIFGDVALPGSADAMGVGGLRPELAVSMGTQVVTANAATLNCALEAAADTGPAGNFQPDTWHTVVESGPMAPADLIPGTMILRAPWIPPFPFNLRPRYLRLNFKVPAATNFTAGAIASALVTLVRPDQTNKFAARNYTVARS